MLMNTRRKFATPAGMSCEQANAPEDGDHRGERQVAGRSGCRDQRIPGTMPVPQPLGVHRHRLRPTKADKQDHQRADGIQVAQRIERQPAQAFSGVIPETLGRKRVGELVDGQG